MPGGNSHQRNANIWETQRRISRGLMPELPRVGRAVNHGAVVVVVVWSHTDLQS